MLNSSLESRLMDQSADCAEINAFLNFETFILVNERGILPHFSNRHFSATLRCRAPVLVSNYSLRRGLFKKRNRKKQNYLVRFLQLFENSNAFISCIFQNAVS